MDSDVLRVAGETGIVKLGCSTAHPDSRAKQLTASTSSPTPFRLLYCRKVGDCNAAEALLHERFADRRINEKREFFRVTLEEATLAMDRIAQMYPCSFGGNDMSLPWSKLFATFQYDGAPERLSPAESAKCRALERALSTPNL